MEISASPKDWEQIAYYLHRLAAKERFRKKNECQAARRLGNLIADAVAKQRNIWMNERRKWNREELEQYIFKQGKTPEEIAKIMRTSPERIMKVLRRLNLLQAKIKNRYSLSKG